jgi:hypothetical protein
LAFNDEEVYAKTGENIAAREDVAVAKVDRAGNKRGEEATTRVSV